MSMALLSLTHVPFHAQTQTFSAFTSPLPSLRRKQEEEEEEEMANINFTTVQEADNFFYMEEMFPQVCPRWIRANLAQGVDALADFVLSGRAPERTAEAFNFNGGDVRVNRGGPFDDSDEDSDGDHDFGTPMEQMFAVPLGAVGDYVASISEPRAAQPQPVGQASPQPIFQPKVVVPPPLQRPSTSSIPRVEHFSISQAEPAKTSEVEISCEICFKTHQQSECVRCHESGRTPTDDSHSVCTLCVKKKWMVRGLKVLQDRSGLHCPVPKCPWIVDKALLFEATKRHPMMAGWILGKRELSMAKTIVNSRRERIKQHKIRMEEPALTDEQRAELEGILQYVSKESIKQLTEVFPNIAPEWLLRNESRGVAAMMVSLAELSELQVPRRMKARGDGKGATNLIENFYSFTSGVFECSVCLEEYPEYLAIDCVDRRSEEERDGGDGHEKHSFCAECVRGHAVTAQEQPVIVRAGLGITCMQAGCVGTLIMAHIEQVLDAKTRRFLEPMVADHALQAAAVILERCKKCDFAAIVEVDKDTQPSFQCRDCGYQYCRKCDREWIERHVGKACDELDPEMQRKRVEEKLNEAVMRKCGKCEKGYVKLSGCNLIHCMCGAQMCYICNVVVADGYKHFSATGCPLHHDVDATRRNKRQQLLQQEMERADLEVAKELNGLR